MTRHKMHCPQKYAIVFHSLLSHYTQHTHRHTRSILPVPIVITPAAQLETTAAHSVKRNKQFSTFLISARFDSISVSISIRFRLQIRFFFFILFNLLACHAGTCPFSFAFLCIILINYIAFYHCEQLS